MIGLSVIGMFVIRLMRHFCRRDRTSEFSKEMDVSYTVSKVKSGADFIVTQGCFDAQTFHSYVSACVAAGIKCPIVPGILMFRNKESFFKMTKLCDIAVPAAWRHALEMKLEDNERDNKEEAKDAEAEPVKKKTINYDTVGQNLVAELMKEVRYLGYRHFHLFTMNDETSVENVLSSAHRSPRLVASLLKMPDVMRYLGLLLPIAVFSDPSFSVQMRMCFGFVMAVFVVVVIFLSPQ